MPRRRRGKPPLLTISSPALERVARWSAGSSDEQWGFLVGRRTRLSAPTCRLVTRATNEPADERSPTSIKVDGGSAFAAEERLREAGGDIPIGAWHSHPRRDNLIDAVSVQITDVDKVSMNDGTVDLICATCSNPRAADKSKQGSFLLVRVVGDVVCRIEGWLRRGKRVVPVELRVRR